MSAKARVCGDIVEEERVLFKALSDVFESESPELDEESDDEEDSDGDGSLELLPLLRRLSWPLFRS